MSHRILRVDTSPRYDKSKSRQRADILLDHMAKELGAVEVTVRDIAAGLPVVDQDWIAAKQTSPDDLTPAQEDTLDLSKRLISELEDNDCFVFSIPIYNFQIPACLKAWVDLVAMPKRTFKYTEDGPVGLLRDKRAVLLFASGGTEIGSPQDHASTYMSFALSFIGITDITILGGTGDVSANDLITAYAA